MVINGSFKMARSLFLLLLSSLIGVVITPGFLTADDVVSVTGLDASGIVETVPLPESKPKAEPVPVVAKANAKNTATSNNVTYTVPKPVTQPTSQKVAPANAISIAGRVLPIVDVADTAVNAGNHVNKYGSKFLYGHNSSNVFGFLPGMKVGNVFTVAYGGTSRNYQIREVQIFRKASETTLEANGQTYRMTAIANGKGRYEMVLMTCYGTSYGNGDASHRFVVFADAI